MSLLPRELHTTDRPSSTAQWTIFGRALELRRPDAERIVTDPYAPVFLTRPARALLTPLTLAGPLVRQAERLEAAGLATSALCRHAFIDEHLLAALATCEQVLVLGAGYDSRAYRFAAEIAGRPVFEVDLPPLSRRKAAVVEAYAELFAHAAIRRVEIDFRTQSLEEQLAGAGFPAGRPTVVVWEGVSMYLTAGAVRGTLAALRSACGAGSVLAMDFWQHLGGRRPYDRLRRAGERAIRLIGEPLTFATPAATLDRLFADAGFELIDRAEADRLEARYATAGRSCDEGMYLAAARLSG